MKIHSWCRGMLTVGPVPAWGCQTQCDYSERAEQDTLLCILLVRGTHHKYGSKGNLRIYCSYFFLTIEKSNCVTLTLLVQTKTPIPQNSCANNTGKFITQNHCPTETYSSLPDDPLRVKI